MNMCVLGVRKMAKRSGVTVYRCRGSCRPFGAFSGVFAHRTLTCPATSCRPVGAGRWALPNLTTAAEAAPTGGTVNSYGAAEQGSGRTMDPGPVRSGGFVYVGGALVMTWLIKDPASEEHCPDHWLQR